MAIVPTSAKALKSLIKTAVRRPNDRLAQRDAWIILATPLPVLKRVASQSAWWPEYQSLMARAARRAQCPQHGATPVGAVVDCDAATHHLLAAIWNGPYPFPY